MSIQQITKESIIELMQDGKMHTTEEINEYVKKKEKLEINDNSSIIRNALFNLKKENPRFKNIARGEYILVGGLEKKELTDVEESINILNKRIDDIEKLNLLTCSEEEVKQARQTMAMIKKLVDRFNAHVK